MRNQFQNSATIKFIGSYDAGLRFIDLYARPGEGAEFRFQPGNGKNAKITVGIDNPWWVVLHCLIHEIMEATYVDMGLRYNPSPDMSKDNGSYTFFMNHTQFSEATARAGIFLELALPALQQYWKKKHK